MIRSYLLVFEQSIYFVDEDNWDIHNAFEYEWHFRGLRGTRMMVQFFSFYKSNCDFMQTSLFSKGILRNLRIYAVVVYELKSSFLFINSLIKAAPRCHW